MNQEIRQPLMLQPLQLQQINHKQLMLMVLQQLYSRLLQLQQGLLTQDLETAMTI